MGKGLIVTEEIQVAYADTDMMGVIYHANYLKWFELGRTKFCREAGFNYLDMEKAGYCAPVQRVEVNYKKAIRYGDKVYVKTWVKENKGYRTTYGYQVVNGKGEICAEGQTTHVVVRKDTFKLVQFKKVFPEWYQKYEEIKIEDELAED